VDGLFWCQLAETLGHPIAELQQTLSLSEVRLWKAKFDTDWDRYEKIEWYLARIAMAIYQVNSVKQHKWRVKDFLLRFRAPGKDISVTEGAVERVKHHLRAMFAIAKRGKKK